MTMANWTKLFYKVAATVQRMTRFITFIEISRRLVISGVCRDQWVEMRLSSELSGGGRWVLEGYSVPGTWYA